MKILNDLFWAIVIGLLVLGILSSCKTREVIKTEYEYVTIHDTLRTHSTDTFTLEKFITQWRDSLVHDSVIVTINEEGQTIYKEVFRDRFVNVYKNDSINEYKAKVDSLQRLSNKDSIKVVEKEVIKTKVNQSGWVAFSLLLVVCGIVVILLYKRMS